MDTTKRKKSAWPVYQCAYLNSRRFFKHVLAQIEVFKMYIKIIISKIKSIKLYRCMTANKHSHDTPHGALSKFCHCVANIFVLRFLNTLFGTLLFSAFQTSKMIALKFMALSAVLVCVFGASFYNTGTLLLLSSLLSLL